MSFETTSPSMHMATDSLPVMFDSASSSLQLPLRILLVEDDAADASLTQIALDATNIPCDVMRLEKGDEVIPYLTKSSHLLPNVLPDLIMLDLGLPKQDGFEIISELAALPAAMRNVPIVILTGYEHFSYLTQHYQLWIPAYLNKPCDSVEMADVLSRIRREKYKN